MPPSEPVNSAFLRLSAMGRIDRSTVLLSSSIRYGIAPRSMVPFFSTLSGANSCFDQDSRRRFSDGTCLYPRRAH